MFMSHSSIIIIIGFIKIHTHTHTTALRLCGVCPGQPGWAGTRRNIHTHRGHQSSQSTYSIYYDRWHLRIQSTCSTVSSTISLQVFFGLPLGLVPSTSYSIHFFTKSLSSFRNTSPYQCNLFCCSTEIMSARKIDNKYTHSQCWQLQVHDADHP